MADCQTIVSLSDTSKVLLLVDLLRHGVLESSSEKVLDATAEEVTLNKASVNREQFKQYVESVFETGESRQTVFPNQTPGRFGAFWDFSLDNANLFFSGDTCVVTCDIRLFASPQVNGQIKSTVDTLVAVKNGNSWRIETITNLFDFLIEGGTE
jgi:hypothetical protein